MTATLHVLCAGAVQGLVKSLLPAFEQDAGVTLACRFGAVGALREALLGGEPCDVMIVTDAMVTSLQGEGRLAAHPRAALGCVRTGVANRRGDRPPDISSPAALRASLLEASAIYFPDPQRATAGAHVARMLESLGLREALAARLRIFPNGATAMHELATTSPAGALGCTQITEIMYTPGIELSGPLPGEFELATVYTAAMAAHAAHPEQARRFIDLLAGPSTRVLRSRGGFELDVPAAR